eukprot:COSAG05_NODE_864_length_6891_cov_387.780330_4_plen_464_part_00
MDDDMFDLFDAPQTAAPPKPAPSAKAAAAAAAAAPKAVKRKAEDDGAAAASATKRTTPAAAAAGAAASRVVPTSLEYQMLDRYVKDKMETAQRLKGLATLNVTPKREVQSGRVGSRCTHEIAFPADQDASAGYKQQQEDFLKPVKRSKEYPFKLDSFQDIATKCVYHGQSVLVSAHTSAGKTAVAEYAIAKSLKAGQRVVYTCPIKALSNQKYRDLFEEFQDVGLMTGDVTINPSASCIVMTTEILRSMLYRGAAEVREIAWVIYDEVHYMRDKERGVVWEESIVMLPSQVRFVFLSATIPNATEFASWVAKVHGAPTNVVYTDYRPTPLQHYMYPSGGEGLYLVMDGHTFKAENFSKVVAEVEVIGKQVKPGGAGSGGRARQSMKKGGNNAKGKQGGDSDIFKVVKMLMEKNMDPCIVFAFSKRETESLALQVRGTHPPTPTTRDPFWDSPTCTHRAHMHDI